MGKIIYLNRAQPNGDGENPLPIQDIDSSNRKSLNTLFGEKIIGTRMPSFAAQFQYGLASDQTTTNLQNGGTAVTANSLLVVSTGTNVAGSAIIQTTDYLRYLPGHEAYMNFTGVFTQGVANSYQRAGLFDEQNGFFVGYEGTDFCVTRRRDSVDYKTIIDLNTIFKGSEGVFDPTKGNIYRISFGYLGFATINFEVMAPCGCWRELYKIEYPNIETVTHIIQTNLPARAEVTNTGNNTDMVFKSGSYEVGVIDGGSQSDASARYFSSQINNVTPTGGNYNIATFRNKSTFNSIVNRIPAQLLLTSAGTNLSQISGWQILKNATISNTPTWTDVNTTDSTFEYSINATLTLPSGVILLPWNMAKDDSFFENMKDYNVMLKPGETASIVVTTNTGITGTLGVAFRWKELF